MSVRTTQYETIEIGQSPFATRITLNRPEQQNAINPALLADLTAALADAEADDDCRLVVLAANGPVFCAGMDVAAAAGSRPDDSGGRVFLDLLKRLSGFPKVIASVVDGKVLGGGVGLVAATDFVYATPESTFALPEMLWGLLPCCVLPYVIRRCGAPFAQTMTLSTLPVDASLAWQRGLVDQVVPAPEVALRALGYRLSKVDPRTIRTGKRFLGALTGIDAATEEFVLTEFAGLMGSDVVAERMGGFAAGGRAPWEGGSA